MKSHAMKARGVNIFYEKNTYCTLKAEAQIQQPSPQKLIIAPSYTETTAFQPYKPVKSEIIVNGSGKQATPPTTTLGPLNLSTPAVAAALSRIQQQQHLAVATAPTILQLRNMLQQHVYGTSTTPSEWLTNPSNQFTLPHN